MSEENEDLTGPLLDPADDAAITALLADLPALEMPTDVAERVATALAAEVPLSGAVPAWAVGGATNVSVLPSQKERDQRKNTRHTRILSGAAAVVLIVGAIAFGTQNVGGGGGSGETAAGGAAPTSASDKATFAADATLLSSSNTTYTEADLAPKVDGLVAAASTPQAPVTAWTDADRADPTPSMLTGAEESVKSLSTPPLNLLSVCVSKLGAAPGEEPVAVDTGTWEPATGTPVPAAVIVLPGTNPARVDVFVVTAGCGDPKVVDDSYLVYYASVGRR